MTEAIGSMLPSAVGVAISPMPIVGVVLMLATPRARGNGLAFLFGWIFGILIVGGVVLALASTSDLGEGTPSGSDAKTLISFILGLGLIALAVRMWMGKPQPGDEIATPKWMQAIDGFNAIKSAGLAVLLSAVNPKNLLLIAAGAVAIAHTGASTGTQIGALLVFTLIASLGVGAPLAIYFALGERSKHALDGLKSWMIANNTAIVSVIVLVIGAKLLGEGIAGL